MPKSTKGSVDQDHEAPSWTLSYETEPIPGEQPYPFGRGRLKAVVLSSNRPDVPSYLRVGVADDGRPISVELGHLEGLTATMLQRFAWARWLTVADQAVRTFAPLATSPRERGEQILAMIQFDDKVELAARGNRLRHAALNPKRPGRAAHPDDFYQRKADMYKAFRQQGSLNPTMSLARAENVSRSTAAGWVRRAREKGFLPKARGNRPG